MYQVRNVAVLCVYGTLKIFNHLFCAFADNAFIRCSDIDK